MNPTRCDIQRCGGSVYIAILGTVTLITIVGLAGLAGVRVQRRAMAGNADAAAARHMARAAIELGQHTITEDPLWRTSQGAGTWINLQPFGQGQISLTAADPVDGDIADSPDDPVLLTGTGIQGDARAIMQVEVYASRGSPALEVAMISGNDLIVDAATVNGDQVISANHNVDAKNGATVNVDAEAANEIKGGTYTGATSATMPIRTLPTPANAMSYYLAQGTPIAFTDLYLPGGNELVNPGFESGLNPWYAPPGQANLTATSAEKKTGDYSMLVNNRTVASAGPTQDITALIASGRTYHVEANVRQNGSAAVKDVRVGDRGPATLGPTDRRASYSQDSCVCQDSDRDRRYERRLGRRLCDGSTWGFQACGACAAPSALDSSVEYGGITWLQAAHPNTGRYAKRVIGRAYKSGRYRT